jgi:hypothetical protein
LIFAIGNVRQACNGSLTRNCNEQKDHSTKVSNVASKKQSKTKNTKLQKLPGELRCLRVLPSTAAYRIHTSNTTAFVIDGDDDDDDELTNHSMPPAARTAAMFSGATQSIKH